MQSDAERTQPDTAMQVGNLVEMIHDAYLIGVGRILVLVRHGEAEQVDTGDRYDPQLSTTGRSQVQAVATRLADWPGAGEAALFTSPLRRAAQTAQAIADSLGLTPETEPELAEVGKKAAPSAIRLPDTNAGLARFEWDSSNKTFQSTAIAGITDILDRSSSGMVIAVTHGGVINAYTSYLLGLNCEFFFLPESTSLTIARILNGRVALDRLNDTGHLDSL